MIKTKSVYIVSIILVIIMIASIMFYMNNMENSESVFDGTLVDHSNDSYSYLMDI